MSVCFFQSVKWSSLGIGYASFKYSAIILDRSSLQKYLTGTCGTFLTFVHVCRAISLLIFMLFFYAMDIEE